jgi:cell division protein FtsW
VADRLEAERVGRKSVDFPFLLLTVMLLTLGLTMLFSSSYFRSEFLFKDPFRFIKRQVLWIGLGLLFGSLAMRISMDFLKKNIKLLLISAFILTCLTFIPGIGLEIQGARRWISIFGNSFQPSEYVKLALIVYLAYILDKKQESLDDPINSLLPPFLMVGIFTALVYLQNDFSTAFFLLLLGILMFFIAKVRIRYFLGFIFIAVPLFGILMFTREHRVRRIINYLDPALDPAGSGYQILVSKHALVKGGFWGQGVGAGTEKYGSLPDAHSDFIFAVLGEEFGFIGVILVLGLFCAFAFRGYTISFRSEDRFQGFLAFGLTTSLLYQALINMAVVSGLVPATGIPLPFFSSGGSSLFITLIMCGLLLNISRKMNQGPGREKING